MTRQSGSERGGRANDRPYSTEDAECPLSALTFRFRRLRRFVCPVGKPRRQAGQSKRRFIPIRATKTDFYFASAYDDGAFAF